MLQRRHIDFASLDEVFALPYVEDQRHDDLEQYRLIGSIGGRLVTFMVEYRADPLGDVLWVVTAWLRPPRNNESMNKQSNKSDALDAIEAIAERAERGEDVSGHFTNRHVAKQQVNIDFPLKLLRQIDAECTRLGVTRQAWIKMACDERLRQVGTTQ